MSSILTWKESGIDLAVELAISGGLVTSGTRMPLAFEAGGSDGQPNGWASYASPSVVHTGYTSYNDISAVVLSTSGGVFDIGATAVGAYSVPRLAPEGTGHFDKFWYGIRGTLAITPGARYRISFQTCKMIDDRGNGEYRYRFYVRNGAGDRILVAEFNRPTEDDWTDSSGTTIVIPAGYALIDMELDSSWVIPNAPLVIETVAEWWGTRLRNLMLERMDVAPAPIVWRDITCDVRGLNIRYGRSRFTERFDVSTLELELLNEDGDYSYRDPHWFGLRPGRQVRVIATYGGVAYPLAYHIVDTLSDGYSLDGHVITKMNCLDPTSLYAHTSAPNAPQGSGVGGNQVWSGTRVESALDVLGYANRALDPGQWEQLPMAASSRTLRDEMGLGADSEGGAVYAERDGSIVYRDRSWLGSEPISVVTANIMARELNEQPIPDDGVSTMDGAPYVAPDNLVTDWSMAKVINEVSISNVAHSWAQSNMVRRSDEESITSNGPQPYSRSDFVNYFYWGDPGGRNATRADDIITGNTRPMLRLNSIQYRPALNPDAWVWTLKAFLNYMVRVWYQNYKSGWGWCVTTHIQEIEHSITPTDWTVKLNVDQQRSYVDAPVIAGDYRWDDEAATWDHATWGS